MVATTHYSELKAYAYERKGVINASMEFDINTLSPTYRLLVGVPGRSNAFAIAERLGLPGYILDYARGEVKEEDQRIEHMIASLEENRLTAEQEREKAENLRQDMEKLRSHHQTELEKLEQQRDRRIEKAEEDARSIVDKARAEAEKIIADLRLLAMEEGASVKEHKLIAARKQLDEAEPEKRRKTVKKTATAPKTRAIGPGDEVLVYSLNQKGHVVEVSGRKDAMVQLGIMKMKVSLDDLELQQSAPAAKPKQKPVTGMKRTRDDNVKSELDLRGTNLEEALMETDRFIDEAFLANLGQVYIIHGKGTGALQKGVQNHLKRHKSVSSYRNGMPSEGGFGVTVVELK